MISIHTHRLSNPIRKTGWEVHKIKLVSRFQKLLEISSAILSVI